MKIYLYLVTELYVPQVRTKYHTIHNDLLTVKKNVHMKRKMTECYETGKQETILKQKLDTQNQ